MHRLAILNMNYIQIICPSLPNKPIPIYPSPMPPFIQPPPSSKDLITLGPRTIAAKHTKRNESGQKPSTVRAFEIILRDKRREVSTQNRLPGREKLDILAGVSCVFFWLPLI